MTKEIIIDGVDVAGCEFCSATGQCKIQQVFQRNEIVGIIEKPYGVHLECNLCDKDCYYKQLKRLEQENKNLKANNKNLLILGMNLLNAHETVRKEFLRADKNKDMWREKAERYRHTLEEIREYKYIVNDYKLTTLHIKNILNKIDEVLK